MEQRKLPKFGQTSKDGSSFRRKLVPWAVQRPAARQQVHMAMYTWALVTTYCSLSEQQQPRLRTLRQRQDNFQATGLGSSLPGAATRYKNTAGRAAHRVLQLVVLYERHVRLAAERPSSGKIEERYSTSASNESRFFINGRGKGLHLPRGWGC